MIIGLVGFIGCGKNTVGNYIIEKYKFKNDSFARPLKDAVSLLFGWSRESIEGTTKESRIFRENLDSYWSELLGYDFTPRMALQRFGTESMRNVFHKDFWIISLIKRYYKNNENVIVTDCRFKNEIKTIRDIGGRVIRIKRDEPIWYKKYIDLYKKEDYETIESLRKKSFIPHVSETDWIGSDFDFTIDNTGSIEELKEKIDKIMLDISN